MSFPTDNETIQGIPSVGVDALRANLDDPELTVIDVRPIAAYNGWRLGAETRGGHVPGARAFPIAWLDAQEAAETARLLADKGATAGRTIVVYGHGRDDAGRLAAGSSTTASRRASSRAGSRRGRPTSPSPSTSSRTTSAWSTWAG